MRDEMRKEMETWYQEGIEFGKEQWIAEGTALAR